MIKNIWFAKTSKDCRWAKCFSPSLLVGKCKFVNDDGLIGIRS